MGLFKKQSEKDKLQEQITKLTAANSAILNSLAKYKKSSNELYALLGRSLALLERNKKFIRSKYQKQKIDEFVEEAIETPHP